ncbi:MAG: hypothetical protein AAGG02_05400 [Cyanobacteria bacterium P01_H01_bin.15]
MSPLFAVNWAWVMPHGIIFIGCLSVFTGRPIFFETKIEKILSEWQLQPIFSVWKPDWEILES